jgi:hypothetical protein
MPLITIITRNTTCTQKQKKHRTLLMRSVQNKTAVATTTYPDVGHQPYEKRADQHECGEGDKRRGKSEAADDHAGAEQREQERDRVRGLYEARRRAMVK